MYREKRPHQTERRLSVRYRGAAHRYRPDLSLPERTTVRIHLRRSGLPSRYIWIGSTTNLKRLTTDSNTRVLFHTILWKYIFDKNLINTTDPLNIGATNLKFLNMSIYINFKYIEMYKYNRTYTVYKYECYAYDLRAIKQISYRNLFEWKN